LPRNNRCLGTGRLDTYREKMENSMSPLTFIATLGKLDYTTTAHIAMPLHSRHFMRRAWALMASSGPRGDDPGQDSKIDGELESWQFS